MQRPTRLTSDLQVAIRRKLFTLGEIGDELTLKSSTCTLDCIMDIARKFGSGRRIGLSVVEDGDIFRIRRIEYEKHSGRPLGRLAAQLIALEPGKEIEFTGADLREERNIRANVRIIANARKIPLACSKRAGVLFVRHMLDGEDRPDARRREQLPETRRVESPARQRKGAAWPQIAPGEAFRLRFDGVPTHKQENALRVAIRYEGLIRGQRWSATKSPGDNGSTILTVTCCAQEGADRRVEWAVQGD